MRFWFFVHYIFRRPRQSQRLFYKHFCHWLINSLSESPIVCENIFMCQHALMVEEGAFSHKIDFVNFCVEDLRSWSAYKSHYWFKSYGNFAKWVERCCEQFDEQVLLRGPLCCQKTRHSTHKLSSYRSYLTSFVPQNQIVCTLNLKISHLKKIGLLLQTETIYIPKPLF